MEEETPVSQPEEVCAPAGARPAQALPGAAQVSALQAWLRAALVPADSAVPQADAQFAPVAPQVWLQDGSVQAVVSPVLERAALAPAAPQAGARYAPVAPLALWVQDDPVVWLADLARADSLPADWARAVPPEADSAEPEQSAAHSQPAEPDGLPADSQGPPQAAQVAQQQAD